MHNESDTWMGNPSWQVCQCCYDRIESAKEALRMSASDYMYQYLECPQVVDNWEVETASIDKYLNHSIKPRSDEAWAAKDALLGAVVDKTKTSWKTPQFLIESYVPGLGWPGGPSPNQLCLN